MPILCESHPQCRQRQSANFNPETGEIYKERNLDGINSGFYYSASDAWIPSQLVANLTWQGTNAKGEPLPEGTKAQVQLTLVPEYYVNPATGQINWEELGEGASISLPVTIDNTAPEITGVSIDPIQKTLTVTAKDNHYIAACILQNPDNGGIFNIKTQTSRLVERRLKFPSRPWEVLPATSADFCI